jgi:hypothetical protein
LATWHMAVSMPMSHDWGVRANDRQVRSCRNEGFGEFGEFTQEAWCSVAGLRVRRRFGRFTSGYGTPFAG